LALILRPNPNNLFNLAKKIVMKNFVWLLLVMATAAISCKKSTGFNIFTVQQDREFGQQLKAEIAANPSQYPVLPFVGNEAKYNYLYTMRDRILASDEMVHRNDFAWELYIINDNNTLNAFAAPGGFMYVYTGLIRYLDEADHLAGVIGHEIAHADQRHSTEQMTQVYGVETLLAILAGNNQGTLTQIAQGLASLSFSRAHEREADEFSVRYLCDTEYASNGAAAFFQKMIDQGQTGGTPAFLSTHPNPENRVNSINTKATELGCRTTLRVTPAGEMTYAQFKALF
jgi:predicted Zn-dependent protease